MADLKMRPVAIAHDYLTQRGGAERVVLALLKAFPEAAVYTSIYHSEKTFPEFRDVEIHATFLNHLKPMRARHRLLFPALAPTFSRLRVPAEVTVCSSSGWAHGVAAAGRKVVYCHNPARWLYQAEQYLGEHRGVAGLALKALGPSLRRWDRRQAATADRYLTSSRVVQSRIAANYGVDAEVVPPPPPVTLSGDLEPVPGIDPGYFLCVSRLLPYKHVDQVVEAFCMLSAERLVIVGTGPLARQLRAKQTMNMKVLSQVNDPQLRWLYQNCAGLVAASHEDFGLTPLEAATFGKPSATLAWGGFLDTVLPGLTGIMFDKPEPEAIASAIRELKQHSWDTATLQAHARAYSLNRFVERLRGIVEEEQLQFRTKAQEVDTRRSIPAVSAIASAKQPHAGFQAQRDQEPHAARRPPRASQGPKP